MGTKIQNSSEKINARRIFLALVSGALYCFSYPKWNFWFLSWIALVPMFLSIDGIGLRDSFLMGWLAGWTGFCGILYWIVPTFQAAGVSTYVGLLATLLLAGYIGLFFGLFAMGQHLLLKKFNDGAVPSIQFFKKMGLTSFSRADREILFMIFTASLWAALEFIRERLFTGFPWGLLGYSLWNVPSLIQVSEFTGVYGVSAMILLVNVFIFMRLKTRTAFDSSAFLIFIPMFANLFLMNAAGKYTHGNRNILKVSILQGNIDQYKKWSPQYVQEILDAYGGLSEKVPQNTDLIVWPETSVPGWIPQDKKILQWTGETVLKKKSYNLVGAVTSDHGFNYNSAFLFSPAGNIEGRYDKIHLVPFGEFVPWQSVLGKWIPVLNELGGFDSGYYNKAIKIRDTGLGVGICYESIFSEIFRRQVRDGAQALVNITNDGWYLDTAAPYQHFSMNVFRAVENRRWLLRAANTGISSVIDPLGRVASATGLNTRAILTGEIVPINKLTLYASCGDWFAWVCAIVSLTTIILNL